MSPFHLYHVPGTRSSRVLWALEESGDQYELEVIPRESRQTPAHRARHPLGRVPVVDDGTGFLFESAALCLHIADRSPDTRLIAAAGTHERALAYQWTIFAMTELEPRGLEYFQSRESSEEIAKQAMERYRLAAGVVDGLLSEREYLVGDGFTIGDLVCGAVLEIGGMLGLIDGFDHINAHISRLRARPARQRADEIDAQARAGV